MIRKEQLYEQILEQIDLTKETDDEELQELIRTAVSYTHLRAHET